MYLQNVVVNVMVIIHTGQIRVRCWRQTLEPRVCRNHRVAHRCIVFCCHRLLICYRSKNFWGSSWKWRGNVKVNSWRRLRFLIRLSSKWCPNIISMELMSSNSGVHVLMAQSERRIIARAWQMVSRYRKRVIANKSESTLAILQDY